MARRQLLIVRVDGALPALAGAVGGGAACGAGEGGRTGAAVVTGGLGSGLISGLRSTASDGLASVGFAADRLASSVALRDAISGGRGSGSGVTPPPAAGWGTAGAGRG